MSASYASRLRSEQYGGIQHQFYPRGAQSYGSAVDHGRYSPSGMTHYRGADHVTPKMYSSSGHGAIPITLTVEDSTVSASVETGSARTSQTPVTSIIIADELTRETEQKTPSVDLTRPRQEIRTKITISEPVTTATISPASEELPVGADDVTRDEEEEDDYSGWVYDFQALSMIGTPYEIKCEDTFAFYEGFVVDFNTTTQKVVVAYPKAWKPTVEVKLSNIRPMLGPVGRGWMPRMGEAVECKAKAELSEPYGFWDATVRSFRDGMFDVSFAGWDNLYDQRLEKNMVRPKNYAQTLTIDEELFRIQVPIPMPLEYGGKMTPLFFDDLQMIRERSGVVHLGFHPPTSDDTRVHDAKVLCVGTKSQLADCKLLLNYLWNVYGRMLSKCDDEKLFRRLRDLERETEKLKSCSSVTFTFDPTFTRFVIGPNGDCIRQAKSLRGVLDIMVEDGVCTIFADNDTVAEKARGMLEFFEERMSVPRMLAGDLVGKGGENIRQIEQKSRVRHIMSYDRHCRALRKDYDEEQDAGDAETRVFIIFGPRDYISVAKNLIEMHLMNSQNERDMIQKSRSLDRELRSFQDYHERSHFEGRQSASPPKETPGGDGKERRRRSGPAHDRDSKYDRYSRASRPRDKHNPWKDDAEAGAGRRRRSSQRMDDRDLVEEHAEHEEAFEEEEAVAVLSDEDGTEDALPPREHDFTDSGAATKSSPKKVYRRKAT